MGVLGDIASAIKKHLVPYCDRIMGQLIHNLQSPDVHRSVKPQILSCFGDIAMGIEEKFEKYIMHVLQVRRVMDLAGCRWLMCYTRRCTRHTTTDAGKRAAAEHAAAGQWG